MSSYRMASQPFLQLFLILASLSTVFAEAITLNTEITKFVPQCALGCFGSFIDVDWLDTTCGSTPSLQCLCAHTGLSGYTIAEGAVECIVAENTLGSCHGYGADSQIVQDAFNMCSGQPYAQPNTHETIIATLVLPSTASGIIIIATPTVTVIQSTTYGSTTFSLPTSTSFSRSTTSTARLSTAPLPPPTATPANQTLPEPQPDAQPDTQVEPKLSIGQIAGITLGASAAVGLLIGVILLARRRRRRMYPDSDDGFMSMSEDGDSHLGRKAMMRATRIFHISPPVHNVAEKHQPSPNHQSSPMHQLPPVDDSHINRDTIGLAISRPRSTAIQPTKPQRPRSKLLPVKPTLTLTIPQEGSNAVQDRRTRGQSQLRESTMTVNTEFADLDSEAAITTTRNTRSSIWRPPPTDPQSASTYYVADKWGNWMLANSNRASNVQAAELDTYTPLTKSPIEKREEARKTARTRGPSVNLPIKPEPAFLATNPIEVSRSSSVYSQASAARPPTSGSFSGSGQPKKDNGRAKAMDRSDSKMSRDSTTTIATDSSGPFDDDQEIEPQTGHLSHLSPVIESPTPTGRSPVSYPKIPGRLNGATLRLVPPPKQPNFYSPPGQPSPTLGVILPAKVQNPLYPPPLNTRSRPKPSQAIGMVRNEKSGLSPVSPASPLQSRYSIQKSPLSPTPQPQSGRRQRRQATPHIVSQQIGSPVSAVTVSSATSSLLAKRVGNDKAVDMSLEEASKRGAQWGRQGPDNGLLSPDVVPGSAKPRVPLPATPTWQPRLTPTRRGDDLFLNVQ